MRARPHGRFRRCFGAVIYVFSVAWLAACSAPGASTGSAMQMSPGAAPSTALGLLNVPVAAVETQTYRIDPAESTLHILVFRGGTMSRLGHNHVVSSVNLQGKVWRGTSIEQSGFEITVPVNDLIVDDNAARTKEGDDFPLNVSDESKAGTKANMLRPTLLDGDQFAEITIRSIRVGGNLEAPVVLAAIQIKGQTREVLVPVRLTQHDNWMQVQGEFEIRQSDFGITPLSIAMGALTVLDTVKIKFLLVARPSADR